MVKNIAEHTVWKLFMICPKGLNLPSYRNSWEQRSCDQANKNNNLFSKYLWGKKSYICLLLVYCVVTVHDKPGEFKENFPILFARKISSAIVLVHLTISKSFLYQAQKCKKEKHAMLDSKTVSENVTWLSPYLQSEEKSRP